MKKNTFLKGATILILCNLLGKVLGAVYRIPLAKMLGPVGMGMYQLVFPLYCLILTVSTSGVPVAISKLVAENNSRRNFSNSKKILSISLLMLTTISLVGAVLIVFGAKFIAGIQGNFNIYICYYGIAPAILFVGVLSAFRGYFQGNLLMFPTAMSSVVEQIVKMIFGLILAERLSIYGVEYAVLGAIIGISISELAAVVFLIFCYVIFRLTHKNKNEIKADGFKVLGGQIFGLAIPITLGGIVGPITAMIDSLLVVNLLMFSGFSSEVSTMFLGLQSGIVEPLVNIPVIIAVSIATVILPNISKYSAENSSEDVKNIVEKAIQTSLCISIACAICFVIFGKQILSFLYGSSLSDGEILTSTKLLFAGSFNIIFLSLVQVTAGVLQGLGHSKLPVRSLLIGCVFKIGFDIILIPIQKVNIFGAIISGAICYFVVFVLNFKKVKKLTGVSLKNTVFYVSIQALFVCLFAFISNILCSILFTETVSLFIAGVVSVAVFFITFYVFFVYEKEQGQIKEKLYN